jgi:hypothetical protein
LAAVFIAEVGTDMGAFRNPAHLAAWAGVCPGNNESAGKRKVDRARHGNLYLKTALVEAANAASRKKGSYLQSKFHRLKARRGHKRAAMAVAHKILIAAYQMLNGKLQYNDLGGAYLDQLSKARISTNLVRRLERMGYAVTITEAAA